VAEAQPQRPPAETATAGGARQARPATARRVANEAPRQQQATTARAAGVAGASPTTATNGGGAGNTTTTTEDQEGSPMDTMQPNVSMQPNDEKWIGIAAGIAASLIPEVIRAVRRKDYASAAPFAVGPGAGDGDAADQEKRWGRIVREAVRAAGHLFDDDKGFVPAAPADLEAGGDGGAGSADGEENVIGATLGGVASALTPMVVRAVRRRIRRKDFAPEDLEAGGDGGATADAEEKWVRELAQVAVPALIQAVPGIISAVRGKDVHILPYPSGRPPRPRIPSDWLRPARGGRGPVAPRKDFAAGDDAGDGQAMGDEKFAGLAVGIAGAVIPEVIRAVANRRKEFELA
jgi:hypothetical protein